MPDIAPYPHELSCWDCLTTLRCNGCGATVERAARCVNARCPQCHQTLCTGHHHGSGLVRGKYSRSHFLPAAAGR